MILFDNKNMDVNALIKEGIKKAVCSQCDQNWGNNCKDKDGFNCDLLNPIILTVQHSPRGADSCTGCVRSEEWCWECARHFDDFENYTDQFTEDEG